jgi:hypothetical protein
VTVLTVVVMLLATVSAAHLLLTFALIRRVRVLQERSGEEPVPVPVAGSRVRGFRVATMSSGTVTDADVADGLVVFVSPSCAPCATLTDGLLRDRPDERVSIFVVGEPGPETDAMAAKVAPLGEVAVVGDEGGAVGAFGVTAFPTVVRVAGGVVESAGIRMADLMPRRAAPTPR